MKTGFRFFLMVLLSGLPDIIYTQTIDLHITDIRNTKGQLCLAIFADEDSFKAERTCWEMKCDKKDLVNGEFQIKIEFRAGTYGLSVLDDENHNGKMDYNLFGIPREGFGFSNYFHKGILKPVFDDFKIDIQKNEIKKLTVKMKYF